MNKKNEKKQVETKKPKQKNASVQLLKKNQQRSNRNTTCR